MKKSTFLTGLLILLITSLFAQTDYCNGDPFFDSGGEFADYSNNEDITTVIMPDAGEVVTVTFLSFDIENNFDFMTVYDGPDDTAPNLGTFTGDAIPGPFTSTHVSGALTFVFESDFTITDPGWEAQVICESITCIAPSNINISNLTSTSVDLDWMANNGEMQWEIEYGIPGFVQGTGTTVTANTNPYTLNGLNPGSNEIYIRAICGTNPGDDDSAWLGPIAVNLPCDNFIAPFTENFALNTIPNCWEESGSEAWNFSTDAAYDAEDAGDHTVGGGTNYAWIDGSFQNGAGQISNLKTPWIDVSGLTTPSANFAIFSLNTNNGNYNTLDVILHEQNGNMTNILHLQDSTGGWQEYTFDISTMITDTVIQLEFIIEENSPATPWFNDILIDDVIIDELPSCPNPNSLSTSNETTDSIDISWVNGNTETSWEIEYGPVGFTLGTGTSVIVNTNPYTLDGLDSGTTYQVYLRAVCGANPGDDDSNWIGASTFTTLFDYCNGDHFYDSGGEFGDYGNNEDQTTVITPDGADIVTVTFLSFDTEENFDTLTVYDGPDDSSPSLGSFSGNAIPGPFTSTHPSGSLTFVFSSDFTQSGTGWEATVFCETVSCPRPSDLMTSNVMPTSVDLSWTPGGTETTWEIEYGEFGFTQGTGTTVIANSNPYTLNGLAQGLRQDIYIRAICGAAPGDDDSYWSEPVTISTPCGQFTAPFYEDFASDSTPGCWFEFGDEQWVFATDATFTAAGAGDYSPSGNTNYAYIDGSGPTGVGHISNLFTPYIDISSLSSPTVQFAIFSHNTNDQTYNTIDVILREQNGTVTNLFTLQDSNGGWQTYTFNIAGMITDTSIQLEFIIEENSPGDAFYNDILIDEIKIDENNVLSNDSFVLNTLEVYPNPVEDLLTIQSDDQIDTITIFDVLGKEVFTHNYQNKTSVVLDMTAYKSGIYFMEVASLNKTEKFKIIKR